MSGRNIPITQQTPSERRNRQLDDMFANVKNIVINNPPLTVAGLIAALDTKRHYSSPDLVPVSIDDVELQKRLKWANINMVNGFMVIPPEWDE